MIWRSAATNDVLTTLNYNEPTLEQAFIPTRFPYTYALDYLRATCQTARNASRAEVSGIVRRLVPDDETRKMVMADLALMYCEHYHVRVPEDYRIRPLDFTGPSGLTA
jgi:hypothetical protein